MRKLFSFLHDCIEFIIGLAVVGGYLACTIYMCKEGIQNIPDMFWYDWERGGSYQIVAVLKTVFTSIFCFGPLAMIFILNWWWWAEDWFWEKWYRFRGKMK